MRKLVFYFTMLLVLTSLTACASKEKNNPPDGNAVTVTQQAKQDEKSEGKSTSNDTDKNSSNEDKNSSNADKNSNNADINPSNADENSKDNDKEISKDAGGEATETGDTPQSAKDISVFIPDGWRLLEDPWGKPAKAEGDLNKDGFPDIAVVIEGTGKIEEAPPRALIIAFGSKDKTYSLSIRAEKAVLKADEGGAFGDPFESIAVDRGSVLLKFYGGSNWRWYRTYRFRFQNDGWYLIGATLGSYFNGDRTQEEADEEDYNLLTGDYSIRKADEKGNLKTTKGNRGKRRLVNLKDFIASADEQQF